MDENKVSLIQVAILFPVPDWFRDKQMNNLKTMFIVEPEIGEESIKGFFSRGSYDESMVDDGNLLIWQMPRICMREDEKAELQAKYVTEFKIGERRGGWYPVEIRFQDLDDIKKTEMLFEGRPGFYLGDYNRVFS